MPHKRDRSPYYYCRRRSLPGYGDTGRLTSKSTSKKIARDMERLLDELAQRALQNPTWYELLDAVCRRRTIGLPDLLKAKHAGTLEALRRSLNDPLLEEAIGALERASAVKRQTRRGLDMLRHYAPAGARLGSLSARTITEMCRRAEEDGPQRNSVRRTLLRAVSLLLRFHLGNAERNRIFDDIQFPAEDDTREVHLLPEEIAGLLSACEKLAAESGAGGGAGMAASYRELSTLIRVALQTSADRGVLLYGRSADGEKRGLRLRDLRIYQEATTPADASADGEEEAAVRYSGEVFLPDTKTKDRTRTVPLTDSLCRELLVLARGKAPDDPVFDLRYEHLDFPWQQVREAAKLTHVRFKDLRAQVSIYGEEAGVPQTVLTKTMGHGDEAMTRRYQRRAAAMRQDQAEAIEQAMLQTSLTATAQVVGTGLRKTA